MKMIRIFATVAAAHLLLATTGAAEQAPVQFISQSVVVTPGMAPDPLTDLEWTLSLSSPGDDNVINHEMMLSMSDYSHEGYFILEDFFGGGFILPFVVDIPPYQDANNNGIEDFFDVSMSVDGIITEGLHGTEDGGADFNVTWYRAAGEMIGGAYIDMPYFELTFEHSFQLMQFDGKFSFDRTGNNLQGTLSVTNVLNPDDYITGPLTVQVVNNDTLNPAATAWTSSLGGPWTIDDNFYDDRYATNFVSFWLLQDGFVLTAEPDYVDWMMVINSQDSNGNGVMDLVEGGGTTGERPTLGIAKTQAGYEISIVGTAGKTYWLEYSSDITAQVWPNHHVVTLIGATQVFTVPADTTGDVYFRLRETP